MAMMRRMLAAGIALTLAAAAPAADPLSVGDPAPKVEVKEFVKGDPVAGLDKGTVYVVEFWATWCGPCRESIPHLTKLQKEHPKVIIIGVSVSERDFDRVKPFVEKMGDQMDYRVAVGAVPKGKSGEDGMMNRTWMEAAEADGIPTAFVVGADGRIAWIGHPMEMDKPLAEIVAGRWDVARAAVAYKEEKVRAKKVEAAVAKIKKAARRDDMKGAVKVIDELVADDPKTEPLVGRVKFQILTEMGEPEKAATYGRRLVDDVYKNDAEPLNELAWSVVAPEAVKGKKPDERLLRLAMAAAERANTLTKGEEAGVLDTLAHAKFLAGDVAGAIALEENAAKLKPDEEDFREHLAAFRTAKEKEKDDK
jgi:thiol-disulfide isomerase/thioredoxin/Flp pilus assembly protein TadD